MRKITILVEILKISIMVESFEKSRYLRKSWILVEICENLDFRQICSKSRFWAKFSKISILVEILKNSWFCSKFFENLYFGRNMRKITILVVILKNLDYDQNFEKSRYLRKILILAEIIEKFRFGWETFWKFWFWSKFPEIAFFVEIFKNRELVDIFEKSPF